MKTYMQRGKVDVFITYEDYTLSCGALKYNKELAGEYLAYIRQMAEEFGLENDVKAGALSRYPDVLTMEEQSVDEDALWAVLEAPLREACEKFAQSRAREGENLKNDLIAKLDALDEKVSQVEARSPEVVDSYREKLEAKVTFFKGMYSDLTDRSICLKLWNGEKWIWTDCNLKGRSFPQDGQLMSPTLVKEGRRYLLNIPVKQENSDARTAKERMAAGEKICAVTFTNQDALTVCCVLNSDGAKENVFFVRGGAEYAHRCRQVTDKIKKSEASGSSGSSAIPNSRYWMKLKNLNDFYSHSISRQVINYTIKQGVKIIVLPEYEKEYSRILMSKAGNFSPIHLSTAIREKIKYKAWQEGLVVLELQQHNISSTCAACGASLHKKGQNFVCKNGHQGNYYLNASWNLGLKCIRGFQPKEPRTSD
mgnify:CR=1 FL=1